MIKNVLISDTQANDLETILMGYVQDLATAGERVRNIRFSSMAFEPSGTKRERVLTLISTPSRNEITDFSVKVIRPDILESAGKTLEEYVGDILADWESDGIYFAESAFSDTSFDFDAGTTRAFKSFVMVGYNRETGPGEGYYPKCQKITTCESAHAESIQLEWEVDAGDTRTGTVIPTHTIIHIAKVITDACPLEGQTMHIYSIEPCVDGAGSVTLTGLDGGCSYLLAVTPLYDTGDDVGPYFGPRQDSGYEIEVLSP